MNERKLPTSNFGFTLIELLIIISIMGILMTTGVAYYQNFNRRQVVIQSVKELKNNLRLAQSKALAGEKPTGCGTLEGYRVNFAVDSYTLAAICNGLPIDPRSYPFVGVTKTAGPNSFLFKVLSRGVSPSGEITLSNTSGYSSKVIVKEGGEISIE